MGDSWRTKLAALRSKLGRAWGFKSRVVLGAAITSVAALTTLPAGAALAHSDSVVAAPSEKAGKLSGKFRLEQAQRASSGRMLAAHGSHSSHSSHSSHRSHRSGAWVR